MRRFDDGKTEGSEFGRAVSGVVEVVSRPGSASAAGSLGVETIVLPGVGRPGAAWSWPSTPPKAGTEVVARMRAQRAKGLRAAIGNLLFYPPGELP